MASPLLLPGVSVFEGAEPLDCIRQTLISLMTTSFDAETIGNFVPNILPFLNKDTDDLLLDEILLVLKQCFEKQDEQILKHVPAFVSVGTESRANLLSAIVVINSVKKANPERALDEDSVKFLASVSSSLAPEFHSFKPKRSYSVGDVTLTSEDAISVMLCLLKVAPIQTEEMLIAALFLWHFESKPASSINFQDLLGTVDASLFRGLFASQPRERFLFLCSDPSAPSTICPVVAEKLDDFSDVEYFLKVLPIPQLHLKDEVIVEHLKNLADGRALSSRIRHPLLQQVGTWKNIVACLDERSVKNAAECFLANVTDVAESVAELMLELPKITKSECEFFDAVLGKDSEMKVQLSHSQLFGFVLSNLVEPPPSQFWELVNSEEPFCYVEGIKEGKAPVAFLGLVHYLIASNRVAYEHYVDELTIPDVEHEKKPEIVEYIKSLTDKKSIFDNAPKDPVLVQLIASALYSALDFHGDKPKVKLAGLNEKNVMAFLTLQLTFFRILVANDELLDNFLVHGKSELDELHERTAEMGRELSNFDEFCLGKIFDVLLQYAPFLENPAVAMNLLLLSGSVWRYQLVQKSNCINGKFCQAICALNDLVELRRSRVTAQIMGMFRHLGKDFIAYLANNARYFEQHPLSLVMFYDSPEAATMAFTEYLDQELSTETIRFLQKCFKLAPKCVINSPAQVATFYHDAVEKGDWDNAAVIAGFLSKGKKLDAIKPTPAEIASIISAAKVDFRSEVPSYLIDLIQQQLKDDKTQVNAIANYVKGLSVFPGFDVDAALTNFSKFFKAKKKVITKALSTVLVPSVDPSIPFLLRPEPLPVEEPDPETYGFVETFVDTLVKQPSAKLFIFARAIFVSYDFLFKKLSDEKRLALFEACFKFIDQYEEYAASRKSGANDRESFMQIHSALLFLSILITEPSFADLFFKTTLEHIESYNGSRLSYVLKIFVVFFAKSRLLASVAASYLIKYDGVTKIANAFKKCYGCSCSLMKESMIVNNTFVEYVIDFFHELSDVDIITIDEALKTENPFAEFTNTGFIRSKLSLVPLGDFETFNTDEEMRCCQLMSRTMLTPPECENSGPLNLIRAIFQALERTPVDSYIDELPQKIDREMFKALEPAEQAIVLRKVLDFGCPSSSAMVRVLLRKPAWVKICALQRVSVLLAPEHYIAIAKVMKEIRETKEEADLKALRLNYMNTFFCNPGYPQVAFEALKVKDLPKQIKSKCLDNLVELLHFKPALEQCLDQIIPVFREGKLENMNLIYMFLMVCVKSGCRSEKLSQLFGNGILLSFLQPKWRSDAHNMEILAELLTSFYRQNPNVPLPRRIVQLVSFLYMLKMYKLANAISVFLSDEQKESMRPIVEGVYRLLSSLPNDDEQITLMNLIRVYPYLFTDRPKLLRTLDLLLSNYNPENLDMIAAIVNVLMPEKMYACEGDECVISSEATPIPMPLGIYNRFPAFWDLVAKHKWVLTEVAKGVRFHAFIASPLNFIFRFPIVQDLDLKLSYFAYSQRKKLEHCEEVKLEFQNENVLENSVKAMMDDKQLSDWKVKFVPSVLDSDTEWYEIVAKELFGSAKGLFKLTPNLRCLTVNPDRNSPEDLKLFKFAGFFVAFSLLQGKKIPAHFAPSLFKQLLDTPMNLRDMEIIDVTVARSYRRILTEPAAQLGLFFTVGFEKDGKPTEVELIPNGAQKAVTDENKEQYVKEMLKFHFNNHGQEQIKAFREGFFTLVEQREIQMFTADELEVLICGSPKIDVEDMFKNCIISSPYSRDHRTVKMFFAMLKSWSQAKLAKLLWFITGSSQLPVDGFTGLKKSGLVIQIERALRPNRVPEAHTCFAILDLPEYTTVDLMEQMFSLALDMCNE